ncbi:MAG: hypothetical protein ACI9G1_005042, partial [Pirellulaceae bacterium]
TNVQAGRRLLSSLAYNDESGWPIAADGSGASLAKVDQDGGADVVNWTHSPQVGGTIGQRNFAAVNSESSAIGILRDSSAAGNDGNPVNIFLTQGGSGFEGEAGVFNGASSFAQIPISVNPATRPSVTMGAWVQVTNINNPARHEILSSDNGGFDRAITVDSRLGTNETGVARYAAFGGSSTGLVTGANANTNDGWTFIAAAFDATGTQTTLYVEDQVTIGAATHNGSQSFLRIGNHPFNIEYFHGLIDNVFVFDGLLNAQQITDIRNGGADAIKLVNGPNLLGLYEFDVSDNPPPPTDVDLPGLAFNEVTSGGVGFQVELISTSTDPLQLENLIIRSSHEAYPDFVFTAEEIQPGALLTLDAATLGFQPAAGERLYLYSADELVVIDAARVTTAALGRVSDGGGDWIVVSPTLGSANIADVETDLVINEIMYHSYPIRNDGTPYATNDLEWIEIYNRSATDPVALTGWSLGGGIAFDFPAGRTIAAGEYLVVANDAVTLQNQNPGVAANIIGNYSSSLANGGELVQLIQPNGNAADEVEYYDGGNWPAGADGNGSSLELRNPLSDNSSAAAWAASDESHQVAWQTYTYRGTAIDDGLGRDLFHEFVLGLLDGGEVLLDDIVVVEDPDGAATSLLPNGSFEGDLLGQTPASWRLIGTHGDHGDSIVVVDPANAANRVLHLRATGPTEDKHNQASTTFSGGQQIDVGTDYEISFRAKWLSGSNQLNTRLYFNFLQETTRIDAPTEGGTPAALNSQAEVNAGPDYQHLQHSPAVPDITQSVTVSIQATDYDGVNSVTLHYSVNEGVFQTLAMSPSGTEFSAEIPAQNSGSVVQFYVSGDDTFGATTLFPPAGVESRALYQVGDGRESLSQLHNVRIVMLPSESAFMYEAVNRMSNHRHGGTVVYDESVATYDVGVRLKGSAFGRNNTSVSGLSLQFPPDQLFRGVHETVSIERSGDMKELLAKHLLNRASDDLFTQYDDVAHIISPRPQETGTALLAMSRTSDVYLESVYGSGASQSSVYNFELLYTPINTVDGNPASPKLSFPYSHDRGHPDLQDLGDDAEAYRWNFQLRGGRSADNYQPLVDLAQALSLNGQALQDAVADVMDVDQWMRTVAMLSINGNDDVYTRFHMHNFRMYLRPEDQKIVAIPWDLDRAFQLSINAHPWTQLDVHGDDNNLGKVVERPVYNRLFWGHVLDIANTTANSDYLQDWASHFSSLTGASYASQVNYVDSRVAVLLGQLPAQLDFAVTSNGGNAISTAESFVTLEGTGWVDVREVRLAGSQDAVPVEWLDDQRWQV